MSECWIGKDFSQKEFIKVVVFSKMYFVILPYTNKRTLHPLTFITLQKGQ